VQLSIDDFGTGYSSLAALKTLPLARLKIDKAFIKGLPDDENDMAVAAAIISLGQKLNLKVIAEGIETAEQADFLRRSHCDDIQGFALASRSRQTSSPSSSQGGSGVAGRMRSATMRHERSLPRSSS
jgi:EAL domain-containing protein (putative c-di-GMP-specific phosphodiesterase class I)